MKIFNVLIAFVLCIQFLCAESKYDVAAFVWPAYQPEPRWKELNIFAHGNGEWQSVYEAVSKKKGHLQPRIPLWGYENEASARVVERKIDAALAAGINVFIYDWYWYDGRPFLEDGLNEGFLKAQNNTRMRFYIMWANHNVNYLWDNKKADKNVKEPLMNAAVNLQEFKTIAERVVKKYFLKPNYYKIDGKPVFGIYSMSVLEQGMGSPENIKKAFEYLDNLCKENGLKGVHIQLIGSYRLKAKSVGGIENPTKAQVFKYLNIESSTAYNWLQLYWKKSGEDMQYEEWGRECIKRFDFAKESTGVPFFPQVTIGWDTNPRFPKEVYTESVYNNTPELFEEFLQKSKAWIDKNSAGMPKLITINSWNEWTEGAYLEPDNINGYGFLNACARVFGGAGQSD